MVRIRVLGRLSVEVDGDAVALPPSRRARALLAWLALRPGAHQRSDVAARFWPDVLDASARTSLRGALAELRRALGPTAEDVLRATRETVELRRGPGVWVDLDEFDGHVAAGRWAEALAPAAGPLLADVDDEWAIAARDDHRRALLAVLGALAGEAAREGRHADAVALTRRQVRLDPLSEELGRDLVRRLAAAGDRAAALAAHAELVERLCRELGVAPAAETRRLAEEVRAGAHEHVAEPPEARAAAAPAAAPGAASVPPPPALALRRGPLVGREAELAALDAVRARSAEEGLQVALVAGEPGIGKTRLALAAAGRALADGATVLYGRSDEDAIVPYEPWLQAVGHVLAHASEERLARVAEDGGAELARLFPELRRRRPDLADPVRAEPETERWRLFEAVAGLVGDLAAERPLLLVLDDVHWADRSTLLLLRHVVRARRHDPLGVVLCVREAELAPDAPVRATVAELRREGLLAKVALRGLEEEEVGTLVARRGRRAEPGFVRALHQETDGNPFFVEEVLRNLPDVSGTTAPLAVMPVPEGVREAVARRLARLGERTREALVLGAVIGRDFDLDLLEEVAGERGDGLVEALDEAVEASVVEEVGVGRYSFLHALIRATLHDGLSRTRRARLHLRVARALEELRGADPRPPHGELAHHFVAAGDPAVLDRAIAHLRAAHGQALEQLAYEEAAGHARRAVQALEGRGAGPGDVLALRLDLGEALSRAGDGAAARDAFAAAAAAARATGDACELARAARGVAGPTWLRFGQVDQEAVALLEEALERLGAAHERERAVVQARLAVALYFARVPDRVRELTDEALAWARGHDDPEALAAALLARLQADWHPDGAPHRLAAAGELLALAERAERPELAVEARRWRAAALLDLARAGEAAVEIEEHARLAAELRRPYELMYTAVFAAMRALHEGRLEDAERESGRVAAFGEHRGADDALQFVGVHVLTACELRGTVGETTDALRAFIHRYPAMPAWRGGLVYALACAGRAGEAREELRRLWPPEDALPYDAIWMPGMACLGLACALLGEDERAVHLRALLAPHAGKAVVFGAGGAVWGSVDHVLGVLAAAAGDREGAEAHLRAALALEERMGATAWARRTARVLGDLAEAAPVVPGSA